ncbi:MAG: YkgJ family cysteine cluster protein [Candidatus Krumholzibacteria bacterium]|nr:YkgJ family cysteine cluster protein [Candidatus Krumholzibacteria bacterium]
MAGGTKQKKKQMQTRGASARKAPVNQCEECIPAKCCMYFSVEIDEPEDRNDWDDMLWIMAHRDAQIYCDDDRWFVMVQTPCRFYDPVRGCLIYPRRPRICREHTWKDCEFSDEYNFDLHFHTYEELERHIRNNVEEED